MMGSRYIRASNISSIHTLIHLHTHLYIRNYTLNQYIQFFTLATSLQVECDEEFIRNAQAAVAICD